MIPGQVVDGLTLLSPNLPIELDRAQQKRNSVLDYSSAVFTPSTIYDVSGKGNHGTITGAVWKRAGSGIWYLDFDGTDDGVSIANPSTFNLGAFSFITWINKDALSGNKAIFSINENVTNDLLMSFFVRTNKLSVYMGNEAGTIIRHYFEGNTALTQAKWQMVAVTSNGATTGSALAQYTAYVDLAAQTLSTVTNDTMDSVANYVGTPSDAVLGYDDRSTPINYLDGLLALVKIKNRVLSASEIAQIYNKEKHLFQGA